MWRSGLPGGLRAVFGGSPLSSGGSPRVLEGKVALVTAGTDGCVPRIGLGVAEALGVAGAQVLLSSRHAHNVQRAVEQLRGRGLQVSGVTCHVGRAEDRERMVQAALDTFGAIDILVSNAAVNPHLGPALEADERIWEKVFQVNVTAAAMLVRLVVPHMERRGGGAIVVMSSIAGYQPMAAGLPAGRGAGRAVPRVPPGRLRGRADPAGGRGGAAPPLTTPTPSACRFMQIRRKIKSVLSVRIGLGRYWFILGGAGRGVGGALEGV
ncbi:dehydrogenase/reductase SDR family member 4-like 2 isoform X6 [Vidua chalybeata]|uniref:dehydrogenase/reductase SDR family member 4-like 2 isoform X6 n=1 Tax=Vidua chalybeata TaxID=81927 RepID=UPI0023A80A54|nr:dehydrogenase/reductase SDR family member 4-like 2 isoform X6 [Vidua chalybeata]